jgi:hypothetical protein
MSCSRVHVADQFCQDCGVIFETSVSVSVCINPHGVDVFLDDLRVVSIHNGETGNELKGADFDNALASMLEIVKRSIEDRI